MNLTNGIVLLLVVAGAGLAVWAMTRDTTATSAGFFGAEPIPPARSDATDAAAVIGAVGGAVGDVLGGIGGLVGSLGTAAGNASGGRSAK